MLEDARGVSVSGPVVTLAAGAWTAVRLPSANVDPGHKVKKLTVVVTTPDEGATYTGPVWVDHVLARGVASYTTDSKPTVNTLTKLAYTWDGGQTVCGSTQSETTGCTTVSNRSHTGGYTDEVYSYDRQGQTVDVKDPHGERSTSEYDEELRPTGGTSEGVTATVTYVPGTTLTKMSTSTGAGTTTQGVDASTGETDYSLDERNTKRKADGLSYVATVYRYDGNGNQTAVEVNRYAAGTDLDQDPMPGYQAQLRKTSYTYGVGGVMSSITDPNGNMTTFAYDSTTGYLTNISTPAGSGETGRRETYITLRRGGDGKARDGSPTSTLDPKGQVTTYEYYGLGRSMRVNYGVAAGQPQFSTSVVFNQHDAATRQDDASGYTTYTYDENDQLLSEARTQNGVTKSASYTYHVNGQPATMSPMGGGVVAYGYNTDGELVSQTDPKDGNRAIAFSHDHEARTATTTYPSGVNRTESWDITGRLKTIALKTGAGATLQSYTYEYGLDAQGEPTSQYFNGFVLSVSEGHSGSAISYGYDDQGRLTKATRTGSAAYNQSYVYDANDNRTSVTANGVTKTATFDGANQLTSQGATTYNYDRNGNTTGYDGNVLSYDASNKWSGGTVNGSAVSFGYDGQGQRVSRTIAGVRTDYWYDGSGLSLETGAADTTFLRDMNGSLLSRSRGGYSANYSTDNLGSVRAVTTDTGALANSYTYDPWGETVASTGTYYNPYKYTGTHEDGATGLYQMGARYYQPGSARFTQVDPLGCTIDDGQRYSFTMGNPANFVDPEGTSHQISGGLHCEWRLGRVTSPWLYSGWKYGICMTRCTGIPLVAGRFNVTIAVLVGLLGWWWAGYCNDKCKKAAWYRYTIRRWSYQCWYPGR